MTEQPGLATKIHPRPLAAIALRFLGVVLIGSVVRLFLTAGGLPTANWYLLAVPFALLAIVLSWSRLRLLPRPVARAGGAIQVGLTLVVLGHSWTSRDYFLADFSRIRPGMRAAEADTLMRNYVAGPLFAQGQSSQSSPGSCRIYHHSFEPAWNADLGKVCYRDGLVTSTEFSPD